MGKYEDEFIIRQRRESEKEKHNSIEHGMYVGDRLLGFELRTLEPIGLEMFLPDMVEPMDEKLQKIKYPMEQRPSIIWTDADASVTFTFSTLDQDAQESELEPIRDQLGNLILSVYPHYIFTDKGKVKREKGNCCWAEFLSPVVGGMLYSILYTLRQNDHLLIGMFNCPADDKDDWKKVVLELMATIREEDVE